MRKGSVHRWVIPETDNRSALSREWLKEMGKSGETIERWKRGGRYSWDEDFSVEVISSGGAEVKRAEDRGLVLRFNYRGHHLLWAGDIGFGSESLLSKNEVHSEILVQGRHSSESSFSDRWLQAVEPSTIILPAAGFQEYRAVWDSAADLERRSPAKIWRQEKVGAVYVQATENGFKVKGFR
jgi:beta-lactamase superfamily II metal-dependent hydrolase